MASGNATSGYIYIYILYILYIYILYMLYIYVIYIYYIYIYIYVIYIYYIYICIYIYILYIYVIYIYYNIVYWPVLTDWWPYRVWLHHPTFDPSTILLVQSEGCQLPPRYHCWLRRYHLGVSPKVQPTAWRCSDLPCNKCKYVAKNKKVRLRHILLGQALEAFKPHGFVCVIKV